MKEQIIETLKKMDNLENVFVRGCEDINQKNSIDRIPFKGIASYGFDNIEDAFDYVLEQTEGQGGAYIEGDEIVVEYDGVHCFTAEEFLNGVWMEHNALDHENVIIFKGKDLGFNFYGDGTIAMIDEIIKIINK